MRRFGAVLFLLLLLTFIFAGCADRPADDTKAVTGTSPSLVPPEMAGSAESVDDPVSSAIPTELNAATEHVADLTDSSMASPEDTQHSGTESVPANTPSVEHTESVQENPQPSETAPEVDPGGLVIGDDVVVTIEDGQKVGGN